MVSGVISSVETSSRKGVASSRLTGEPSRLRATMSGDRLRKRIFGAKEKDALLVGDVAGMGESSPAGVGRKSADAADGVSQVA
ncbi:MAG: hypothetical protein ABUL50_10630 [Rhizobacter sp.]